MIGDPSGKSEERNLLSPEAARRQPGRCGRPDLARFLDFDARTAGPSWWTTPSGWARPALLEFLRDVGKLFSVNEMVRKESVRARLEGREQSLSFTEFSYMLLQAWDFLQLYDRYHCELQLGGSDQWGNITEGIDLIRRRRGDQAFGLTSPLVTKADGTKFGKTEAGSVWLDPARTSPYAFFQFWLRTGDAEVGSYLRRFTFLGRERIEELDEATASRPERRAGPAGAGVRGDRHGARRGRGPPGRGRPRRSCSPPGSPPGCGHPGDARWPTPRPSRSARAALEQGQLTVVDALLRSGLADSRGDARQLLSQGSVYVNGGPDARGPAPRRRATSCTTAGSCCAGVGQPAVRAGGHRR